MRFLDANPCPPRWKTLQSHMSKGLPRQSSGKASPAAVFPDSVDSALGQGAQGDGSGTRTPSLRAGAVKPRSSKGEDDD